MSVPPPMTGNPEQDRKALEAFKKSEVITHSHNYNYF